MRVERDYYLKQLISRKDNGLIKIITGLRRCGKSYLLFTLYYDYLLQQGVPADHILCLSLDDMANARYRNPMELDRYVREAVEAKEGRCYVFLDEIQFVKEIDNPWLPGSGEKIGFVDVVLGLMRLPKVDLYITGSNSRMLSSDIVTQFRDKGDEIRVHPFSYTEVCRALGGESESTWQAYYTYGGMPRVLTLEDRRAKVDYLTNLFENTYLKDVLERYKVKADKSVLDDLVRIIASGIGSLSNPKKIADTFRSGRGLAISSTTIDRYLDYFADSFLIHKAFRYDVKGRKYIGTPLKYYFSDVGIRNALLEFRQQEENHIMENILYNELVLRGYSVDTGVVTERGRTEDDKDVRTQLEVDFIVRGGDRPFYVQSALNVDTAEKRLQETASLVRIPDSFAKLVVVRQPLVPWYDEHGICYVGIREFLSGSFPGMGPL